MIFHFSTFIVNEKNSTLINNDQLIEIEPKIFSLLCFFCRNTQRAISREEFIEKVWQGRIVSDAAINRAVGELRKIIEADIKDPQFIITISKVGYRFNATISQPTSLPLDNSKELSHKNYRKLLSISFFLVAAILLTWFGYINDKPQVESALHFNVSQTAPLTTIKGSAFKQKVFSNGQTIFLHKDPANVNVQLWLQPQNLPAYKLTNDNYYYTSAIFKDADTVFASRLDNLTTRNCQIVKLTISTNQLDKIIDCAERAVTYLAYDNQSRKLYFNYRESVSQPYAIRSIQLDTGRIQQLTHASPKGNARGDYLFALSPGGEKMAIFEYQQDGAAMLKIIEIKKPTEVKRYQSFESVSSISWFNDKALLISELNGIISYDLTNQKIEYIIQRDNITQADFSTDLSLLSYVKFDITRNIYQRSELNQKHETPVTQSTHINSVPNYANTSNSLAYFSTDTGMLGIQLIDKDGNISKLNFPEKIKHFSNLTWSRDDSAIFASINSKIFLYSLEKQVWREIKTNLKSIHYVEVMEDQQVIVSSDESGDWQLWQVDLTTENAKKITTNGGYSASYIPNKNLILVSKYSQNGLFALNLKDLSESEIDVNFKVTDWNKWQVRGENIYLWENKAITVTNLVSREKSTRWQFNQANPSHFSINFDASKIAYSITEQEKSTIWKSTVSQIITQNKM